MSWSRLVFPVLVAIVCMPAFSADDFADKPRKADVRLLVDVSGSMRKTDPLNLRVPAVRLIVNLAPQGSQMGIWAFGQDVNALAPHATVDDKWKATASGTAARIASNSLFTQIGQALEHAVDRQWQNDPALDRTIILLSDGKVDVSADAADSEREEHRIFSYVVPRLKNAGYKVHAIALSKEADTTFLKRLADETGGTFSMALTADDLMKIFVAASDKTVKPLQVPLVGGDFKIDPMVKEFTALIYRKAGSPAAVLVTPSKKKLNGQKPPANAKWFTDEHFDLVTVTQPESGTWKIEGDLDPNNRVTVVSNLDLSINGLPTDVLAGEKLVMEMALTENGKPITNPRFLTLMDITFKQGSDRGQHFEGRLSRDKMGQPVVPMDGVYRARLGRTLDEGQHEFTVSVDGKTFERSRTQRMVVHGDVLSTSVETEYREGHDRKYVVMRPLTSIINSSDLVITARIVDPAGSKGASQIVKVNEAGQWRLNVPATGEAAKYQVMLQVKGTTRLGNPFDIAQPPVVVDYTPHTDKPLIQSTDSVELVSSDLEVGEAANESEPAATPAPEPVQPAVAAEAPAEPPAPPAPPPAPEPPPGPSVWDNFKPGGSGFQWLAFAFGNLLLMGGGIFVYLNFMQDSDEEQARLVEELVKVKERSRRDVSTPAPRAMAEVSAVAPASVVAAPGMAAVMPAAYAAVSPVSDEVTAAYPAAPGFVVPDPSPAIPDRGYRNDAEPLDVEEDALIEIDDDDDEADELGAQLAAHAAGQARRDDEPEPAFDDEPLRLAEEALSDSFELPDEPEAEAVTDALPVEAPAMPQEMPMDDLETILAEQELLEAQFAAIESSLGGDTGAFAEDEFKLDSPST